jgi:DNA-directed RNA polymerase specialized sigma24 family protein
MRDSSISLQSEDAKLAAATLERDKSSFGVFVARYGEMAVALAMSNLHNPAEAEDVARDSVIKAYSHLHQLRDPSCFAGWLSKIIFQQSANHFRKIARNNSEPIYDDVYTLNGYFCVSHRGDF